MRRNRHKIKSERGNEAFLGGGTLSATLDQIVEYAKGVDDKDEAERIELMCYRLFGRSLTPESADKIAEIPKRFKKKCAHSIKKFVTINNGDKVDRKTIIPSVGNFQPQIQTQHVAVPMLQTGQQNDKLLDNY